MRIVIIRKPRQIAPFNEPATKLRILNKTLRKWQNDLLLPHSAGEPTLVDDVSSLPQEATEMLVTSDNLWFDEPFLNAFLTEARSRRKATRAAFRAEDPAFLQQGLRALTRSYEQRGDLVYVDLWYFPVGPSSQVEPIIISSEAQEVGYYNLPAYMQGKTDEVVWWLPRRAVCAIDSWVHVFFANIVFGVFAQASRFEQRGSHPTFRLQAMLRSIVERKPLLASSAYVKVGKNGSIDPSTIFQGPVSIGDNVTIGPGCVITQSVIGNNVTLNHSNHLHMCVLSDGCFFPWGASAYFSAFMENSSCGQNATLEMSVIGRNSYVGSGTILTDFNMLPTPISLLSDNRIVETDMPVLGACVGHNCRVGSGLVVYPARTIESDVVLFASPTRHVIMKNISYEESDHHAMRGADLHPRMYPREEEQSMEAQW